MEKAVATHSSALAWKLPWMEEPGRLQSMGSWRVRHDWATSLSLFTFMHWRRKWQPTPAFLPGESQGRGAWWAAICGVTQSRTRLKWLSSKIRVSKLFLKGPDCEYFRLEGHKSLCCNYSTLLLQHKSKCVGSNHIKIYLQKHVTDL